MQYLTEVGGATRHYRWKSQHRKICILEAVWQWVWGSLPVQLLRLEQFWALLLSPALWWPLLPLRVFSKRSSFSKTLSPVPVGKSICKPGAQTMDSALTCCWQIIYVSMCHMSFHASIPRKSADIIILMSTPWHLSWGKTWEIIAETRDEEVIPNKSSDSQLGSAGLPVPILSSSSFWFSLGRVVG